MRKIKNLKNKIITIKNVNEHKKIYYLIRYILYIIILPIIFIFILLEKLGEFGEYIEQGIQGIFSRLADNIFKYLYYDECRDKEKWEDEE